MALSDNIISNDSFFIQGLIELLGSDFINEFFLIIDLDFDDLKKPHKIFNTKKTVVAFTSKDRSFYKSDLICNVIILDKKISTRKLLNKFIVHRLARSSHVKFKLTHRERQMLHMIIKGDGVSLIAEELGLSKKTIYAHRRNMMHKLGCENRIAFYKLCLNNKCFSNLI